MYEGCRLTHAIQLQLLCISPLALFALTNSCATVNSKLTHYILEGGS